MKTVGIETVWAEVLYKQPEGVYRVLRTSPRCDADYRYVTKRRTAVPIPEDVAQEIARSILKIDFWNRSEDCPGEYRLDGMGPVSEGGYTLRDIAEAHKKRVKEAQRVSSSDLFKHGKNFTYAEIKQMKKDGVI